jgi:hypothetical protein
VETRQTQKKEPKRMTFQLLDEYNDSLRQEKEIKSKDEDEKEEEINEKSSLENKPSLFRIVFQAIVFALKLFFLMFTFTYICFSLFLFVYIFVSVLFTLLNV